MADGLDCAVRSRYYFLNVFDGDFSGDAVGEGEGGSSWAEQLCKKGTRTTLPWLPLSLVKGAVEFN